MVYKGNEYDSLQSDITCLFHDQCTGICVARTVDCTGECRQQSAEDWATVTRAVKVSDWPV